MNSFVLLLTTFEASIIFFSQMGQLWKLAQAKNQTTITKFSFSKSLFNLSWNFLISFGKDNPKCPKVLKRNCISKYIMWNSLEIIPEQRGPIFQSGFSPCRRWCRAKCHPPPPFRKSPSFLSTFGTLCHI